jgi:hypothetical protein
LEGGDGGVDEGVLVGGKVEQGIKAGLAGASGPPARQCHEGRWHVGLTLHLGQRRSLRRPDEPQAPQKPLIPGGWNP